MPESEKVLKALSGVLDDRLALQVEARVEDDG